MKTDKSLHIEPFILGDHLALDFLNTVFNKDDDIIDFLQTDSGVIKWMTKVGLLNQDYIHSPFIEGQLSSAAIILRENIRALIVQRKKGEQGNTTILNQYLKQSANYSKIVWKHTSKPQIERIYISESPQCFLAPIAEATVELLIIGDFSLVKSCEHSKCTLCFYDSTKSHKRRWCSMASCGNRYKVAKFRQAKISPN